MYIRQQKWFLLGSICWVLPVFLASPSSAASLRHLIVSNDAVKRNGRCPPWQPFQCPDEECIPIKYLCDGNPDCKAGYDENEKMCTAALRPPMKDTMEFLNALLISHGDDFLTRIFGEKAADRLHGLGGLQKVAVALSESPTVEDFGKSLNLSPGEVDKVRENLMMVAEGNTDGLGFKGSEADDLRFYVEKLIETGFMM